MQQPPGPSGAAQPPPMMQQPPMMRPPTHGAPGGAVRPGGGAQPHYAALAGGAGEPDQALAEKFHMLSIVNPPGTQAGQAQPEPEQTPRPLPHELDQPYRFEARTAAPESVDNQAHPAFVRMTTGAMPMSTGTKSKAAVPIGAIIQPMATPPADCPVPVVNFSSTGVVRCRRCRTYINCFVKFLDGGRRWRCNVCQLANDVPADYFCDLDGEGRRRDRMDRPELHLATCEFVAAAEYMVRPPQPPVYLFLIEASYASVSSGMLRCVASTLAHTLDRLPGEERTQIGIMTFDTTLHFYNLSSALPQMMVVPEIDETFIPMPDDLLCNLAERKDNARSLLDKLPEMFASTQATEVALGPALKAAYQLIQHIGGKLEVFSATRPTVGDAKLKNREGGGGPGGAPPKAADGKGSNLLLPDIDFYKNLAVDCSKQQICIDVWATGAQYQDLASIGQLAKHTTGSVYHYPAFSDVSGGERLSRDLQHNLTREQGWEAVMRVRVSRGLRIAAFHGHFFIRGTDLLALPNVDEDKTFAIEIAHEENALAAGSCCMQAALLYTTSSGERRIRVHTASLPVTTSLTSLYDSADLDACVNLMGRVAIDSAMTSPNQLVGGVEKLQSGCTELLRAYRSLCPQHAKTMSTLLMPDALKLLPLYTLGLMKAFTSGDLRADERSQLFYLFSTAPVVHTTLLAHPRLVQLQPQQQALTSRGELPRLLPLTVNSLTQDGAYLAEDGQALTMWLGKATPTEFLQQAFGWPSLEGVDASTLRLLPPDSTPLAGYLNGVCDTLRLRRAGGWLPLRIVKQGEDDVSFMKLLVEDQTRQMMAYPEFLTHCHRYILSKVA
jgi:protein transport protein SEC24